MDQYVALLKQFVGLCKANPDLLHDERFGFYRDYLKELGATIPSKKEKSPEEPKPAAESSPTHDEPMEAEPEEEPIPCPELDNSGVIEPDAGEALPMGEIGKEVSEDDLDKANDERDKATAAFSDGDFEKALEHYTNSIQLNPGSAILHAKRANVLLKLKRPIAAIADCDKAISINPDSAQGYKFRGRANRLLGKWLEAHADLTTACKLDYDDTANEWLKEVVPNAKKLQEYKRAVERQKEEKELRERRERVRRAQEANRKAQEEAARRAAEDLPDDFGMPGGGMGGGMPPGMAEIFSDPEIMEALNDPEVAPILMEAMTNPAALTKHLGNAKVMRIIAKLQGKMGGGGMPGFFTGPSGGPSAEESGAGAGTEEAEPPKDKPTTGGAKMPDPDLD